MIKTIIVLAVFYFLASLGQFIYLQSRIEKKPTISESWITDKTPDSPLYHLEYLLIQNRYHQGNTSLMSRLWLKYIGFVTGMTLSLIGAVFILGKLREDTTELQLSTEQIKMSFLSSSPGIILAFLGTLIMITTILDNKPIDINDANVYLGKVSGADAFAIGIPPGKDTTKESSVNKVVVPKDKPGSENKILNLNQK